MLVKRLSLVLAFILVTGLPQSIARAEEAATAATVTKKAEPEKAVSLKGFDFRLGLQAGTKANFEPESANLELSWQLKVGWSFGKLFWPKKWAKGLVLSARIEVNHEPVGYSDLYRTPYMSSDYKFAAAENLPIGDRGYFISQNSISSVPRTQQSADRTGRLTDLKFTLAHPTLYKIPKTDIAFDGMIRLMVPTSTSSLNSTLMLALTFALGASRDFSWKVGKTKQTLSLAYIFGFTKYFHRYKTGQIDYLDDRTWTSQEGVVYDSTTTYNREARNPAFAWSNDVSLTYDFYKNWSLGIGYQTLSYRTYTLDDNCSYQYNPNDPGAVTNICQTMEDWIPGYESRGIRDFHEFEASLGYQATKYLKLTLAMSTLAPMRKPNSEDIQQPIFVTDRNGYSSIVLTAQFAIDKLVTQLTTKK
jgi:hypothetical protein